MVGSLALLVHNSIFMSPGTSGQLTYLLFWQKWLAQVAGSFHSLYFMFFYKPGRSGWHTWLAVMTWLSREYTSTPKGRNFKFLNFINFRGKILKTIFDLTKKPKDLAVLVPAQ